MKEKVIVIGSEGLGRGDDALGKRVLNTFLATLLGKEALPAAIFLVNSGVKLAVKESDAYANLEKLESAGVQILACLTCVKHYNLVESIAPHRVSSMDTLVELLSQHDAITL